MSAAVDGTSGLRPRDLHNGKRVNVLSLVWSLCFVGATALLAFFEPPPLLVGAIVIVPLVAAYVALGAYRRFLREADELLRKIHLEALSVGAAAALAVGTTFLMLMPLGASAPWGLTFTLAFLCLGYAAGVIRGMRAHCG